VRGTRTDSNRQDINRIGIGVAAGIVGLMLLLAAELTLQPMPMVPVLRYRPPARAVNVVTAANPAIGYAIAPTVDSLRTAFVRVGYDLDTVRETLRPVPRLRLINLPEDLPDLKDVEARKELFLGVALPMILEVNQHVAGQRARLLHIAERLNLGQTVPEEQMAWLARLAEEYKTVPDRIDLLLRRVDTVPVSLMLAQAAAESGWGTSRFALEGNAIFGQWTTARGKGLVPLERPEGKTYKVRAFDRLIDSFSAYLLNINTHRAYVEFRIKRAEMRRAGRSLDGAELAGALTAYSERGQDYIDMLRGIIRVNRLQPFDKAQLGDTVVGFVYGS